MNDDAELLRNYVENDSEQAFAELVNRHIGLVYHAALRQTGGNVHCAEEVAQSVFVDLARKAKSLIHRPVLSGWLYTSTRYAASKLARAELRRQAREAGAHIIDELAFNSSSSPDWNQLGGVIDDALHALSERDREAVLLRFFEGRPFSEVGDKLSVSEDAARVRVDRALDKLHGLLLRRGVTSTAVALASGLGNQAMASAPAGLAVKISGTALASLAATGGTTAIVTFFGLTQLQFGLAVGIALGGGGAVVYQQRQEGALLSRIAELREQQNQLVNLRKQDEQRPLAHRTSSIPRIQSSATERFALRAELASLKDKKDEAEAYKAQLAAMKKQLEAGQANLRPEERSYAPIYRPSQLDERPVPLTMVEPELSPELRREGGAATVEFIVDQTGIPRCARLAETSNPELGRAALAGVSQWKFRPGVVDGKPVSTRMSIPFRVNPERPGTATSDGQKRPRQTTHVDRSSSEAPFRSSEESPHSPVLWPKELDEASTPLERAEPVVSSELQDEGKTVELPATVVVIVDGSSTPRTPKFTNSSNLAFGRTVLAAVSKRKFKPGVAGAKAVSTWLTIPFLRTKEESSASARTVVKAFN